MPYKRTCTICHKTQKLVGVPRAEHCHDCKLRYFKPRLGTGRRDKGNSGGGYRMIYCDGKRVYEHRFAMEQKLGRKLSRNEHVHHIDGNRINNDIENLELVSASDHAKLHFTSDIAKIRSQAGLAKRWGRSA